MAEPLLSSSDEKRNDDRRSKETIVDVCTLLREIRNSQIQLNKQVENLVLSQERLFIAQETSQQHIATLTEKLLRIESVDAMAASPQVLDAGSRLTSTFELLEMLILELPNEAVLCAQRVNRQFKSVIAQSRPLQHKLFFNTEPPSSPSAKIVFNPILKNQALLQCLPTYCDDQKTRLAYCYRPGRQRLYCQSATIIRHETRGEVWIDLRLGRHYIPASIFESKPQPPEGLGSWKRMYITQPSCDITLRVTVEVERKSHLEKVTYKAYSGKVTDDLLDGLLRKQNL
ncbi:hypothetical protein LTR56_025552 [Elasticomyces elasticus]|nr:hypothetical protein LTR56_025552 [Elasticomyces elasticus]KAK3624119.1 hypothetical protein LTR22_024104 [Elasticomyces elasticus]KAK5744697.1 hypothetical protein LTS12_023376 [Elasticomyces elasticus]